MYILYHAWPVVVSWILHGGSGEQLSESGSHGALFADPQGLLPDGQVTMVEGLGASG